MAKRRSKFVFAKSKRHKRANIKAYSRFLVEGSDTGPPEALLRGVVAQRIYGKDYGDLDDIQKQKTTKVAIQAGFDKEKIEEKTGKKFDYVEDKRTINNLIDLTKESLYPTQSRKERIYFIPDPESAKAAEERGSSTTWALKTIEQKEEAEKKKEKAEAESYYGMKKSRKR
jgi:hypothetical protein